MLDGGYSVPELPLPIIPELVGDISEEPAPVGGRGTWGFIFGAGVSSLTGRLGLLFAYGLLDCGDVSFNCSVPP